MTSLAEKELQSILDYRKTAIHHSVSTEHKMATRVFDQIRVELTKKFKSFSAEFNKGSVKITIPCWNRRI